MRQKCYKGTDVSEYMEDGNHFETVQSSDLNDFYGGATIIDDMPNALSSPLASSSIQSMATTAVSNSAESTQMVKTMVEKGASEEKKSLKPVLAGAAGLAALMFFLGQD